MKHELDAAARVRADVDVADAPAGAFVHRHGWLADAIRHVPVAKLVDSPRVRVVNVANFDPRVVREGVVHLELLRPTYAHRRGDVGKVDGR
jgi:hypothetical protein